MSHSHHHNELNQHRNTRRNYQPQSDSSYYNPDPFSVRPAYINMGGLPIDAPMPLYRMPTEFQLFQNQHLNLPACDNSNFQNPCFQMNPESMKQSLRTLSEKEKLNKKTKHLEKQISSVQHSDHRGRRPVTLDNSDNDAKEHSLPNDPLPSSSSAIQPSLKSRKRKHDKKINTSKKRKKAHKEKKKKYRKRNLSTGSSANCCVVDNDKHRSRKNKHKKRKRHRHSSSLSSSSSSSSSSGSSNASPSLSKHRKIEKTLQKPIIDAENYMHAEKNSWKLLKPSQYRYNADHLVFDVRGDKGNMTYEKMYSAHVPKHQTLNEALNGKMQTLIIAEKDCEKRFSERYFAPHIERFFRRGDASERRFRRIKSITDYIKLSDMPYMSDEEKDDVKAENALEGVDLNRISIDDYAAIVSAKKLHYETADLEGKLHILRSRHRKNPKDVDAWIEYAKLQKIKLADVRADQLYEVQKEILDSAIKLNQASVELALEKIRLMEAHKGSDAPEVADAWKKMENRFINDPKMWKLNILMKQNNRSTFELSHMIDFIDKCISNLVDIKDEVKLSHPFLDGTEEFLVDRLVHRCKLLLEAGFMDKVVAILQAFTEFHFFAPTNNVRLVNRSMSRSRFRLDEMKTFWTWATPRVGDPNGIGWKNSQYNGDPVETERAALEAEIRHIQCEEQKLMNLLETDRPSDIDTWRQIEQFRAQHYWRPVRCIKHDSGLYEFESRVVHFETLSKILFQFDKRDLAFKLVLRVLQLIGAVIPGMPDYSQENIFRNLDSNLFPQLLHNYHELDKFFDTYFDVFATALSGIDRVQILAAKLATRVKFLQKATANAKERLRKMKVWSMEFLNLDLPIEHKTTLMLQTAIMYEQLDIHEMAMHTGMLILQNLTESIWDMPRDLRAVYLEVFRWVCRRLPFQQSTNRAVETPRIKPKAQKHFEPKSKAELLVALAIHGNLKERVDMNKANIIKASSRWKELLDKNDTAGYGQRTLFGYELEAIVELGALYFYDNSNHHLTNFKQVIQKSPAGIMLCESGRTEAIFEMFLRVYEHKMSISAYITPNDICQLLVEAIKTHPHNVSFLREFLVKRRPSDLRYFLQMNPGDDELARRVRACALITLEWREYVRTMALDDGFQRQRAFAILRRAFEMTAPRLIAESDMPEAFAWCLLMHIEQESNAPIRRVDDLFAIVQKQCPWSKLLLYEAARNRSDTDGFSAKLRSVLNEAGLQNYCQLDEVPLLYAQDAPQEIDEFMDDEDEEVEREGAQSEGSEARGQQMPEEQEIEQKVDVSAHSSQLNDSSVLDASASSTDTSRNSRHKTGQISLTLVKNESQESTPDSRPIGRKNARA